MQTAITAFIPAVCCSAAVCQAGCATFGTLTPWKGGGFGMFAAIDGPTTRFISVTAVDVDERRYRVIVPFGRFSTPEAFTARFAGRLVAFPTTERLQRLAQAVLNSQLIEPRLAPALPAALAASEFRPFLEPIVDRTQVLEVIAGRGSTGSSLRICEVRTAVSRLRFDQAAGVGRNELVHEAVVERLPRPAR